ncbi:MAG: DEAD/DEAH box helicase [Lentisphaeria bacterium]
MDFTDFGLNDKLLSVIKKLNYTTPTPIQAQAIPPLMKNQDVMGLAQTGTGKTAAYVLPIIQKLVASGPRDVIRCLVVAPTRELAAQINEVFAEFAAPFGLHTCAIYGGVNAKPQLRAFKSGVEIIVACPGRLLDHLQNKNASLNKIEVLVLDEADQMFDMGFLPDIRKILAFMPKKRQTMLFSATMPEQLRHLAYEILYKPITIEIEPNHVVDTVSHALYPVEQHLKAKLLLQLLKELNSHSVIVFTRTKFRAKRLSEQLCKDGFLATQLQGNMSQNKRKASLNGFKEGTFHILVATDIAARGIDVNDVTHVINFDIPDTVEAYTHRIGRTGRALQTGEAFTFYAKEDRDQILAVERKLGYKIERKFLNDFDYRAPAPPRSQRSFSREPRFSSAQDNRRQPPKEAHNGQDRNQRGKKTTERYKDTNSAPNRRTNTSRSPAVSSSHR